MTKEEAIKIVRNICQTDTEKEALATLIPELAESEDERIRKETVSIVKQYGRICKKEGAPCPSINDCLAWLEKQKEQKPIKVYRVENEKEQKGLWRKFDGTWEPLFDILTDGLCRDLPMEDNDLYRADGKQWFASAPSRQTLQKWFSKRDLEELTSAGFTISEFEVRNYKKVSEFEYIFTRDSITKRTYLNVSDIYPEQKPAENGTRAKIISRATSEKQVVLLSESNGSAEIGWDTRSLEDAKNLLEYGLAFINREIEKIAGLGSGPDYATTEGRYSHLFKQQEQPKQEWSEEDKRKLNRICEILGHAADDKGFLVSKRIIGDREAVELQDFLESLLPRLSWRPSEEQMKALLSKLPVVKGGGDKIQDILESLYDDLKKLM